MEHQKIFATNIFLLDNFISETDTMKKYIGNLWNERDYDSNWQTKSADLHTKKEFQHFSTLVLKTAHDFPTKMTFKDTARTATKQTK